MLYKFVDCIFSVVFLDAAGCVFVQLFQLFAKKIPFFPFAECVKKDFLGQKAGVIRLKWSKIVFIMLLYSAYYKIN